METCLYSGYNPLHLWIYYYVMIYKYPKYIIGLQSVPYIEIPGFLKTRNLEDFVAGGGRVRGIVMLSVPGSWCRAREVV